MIQYKCVVVNSIMVPLKDYYRIKDAAIST